MRKIILMLILATACYLPTYATITATIGTVSAVTGQTATIPITLSGANGADAFWGCELKFNYDNTKVSIAGGSFTNYNSVLPAGNWISNMIYSPSTIYNSYANNGLNDVDVPNNTVIFNIQVTYTGSVATPITWDASNSSFFNVSSVNLVVNWVNGAINPFVAPPAAPVLSSPIDNAVNIATITTLSWNAVATATSYDYEYSTSGTFATNTLGGTTTNLSIATNTLQYSTQYFWRVRAKRGTEQSAWSNVFSFTTVQAPIVAPVLSMPANNAVGISISPALSWNIVPTATSYSYECSANSSFSTTIASGTTTNLASPSVSIGPLQYSTMYFWRVRAIRGAEQSAWSDAFTFTTSPATISAPVLSLPANNAANASIATTLSWNAVATAISYDYEYSISSNFAANTVSGTTTNLSVSTNTLQYSTQYFWRVRANRGTEQSVWSNVFTFSTIPSPLVAPVPFSPSNNGTNIILTPTLSWNAVATTTSYYLEVSSVSDFSSFIFSGNVSATSKPLSNLTNFTKYYWRVKSIRNSETSSFSATWNFTTFLQAPSLQSPANTSIAIAIHPTLNWAAVPMATSYLLQVSKSSNFADLQTNELLSTNSKVLTSLEYNAVYYWRVSALNGSTSSGWSSTFSFTAMSLPAEWNVQASTGSSATIGFKNPLLFKIGQRSFANGDALGAFYSNGTEQVCGGILQWDGSQFGLVVWGDDQQTVNKEGFALNEAYSFKVWDSFDQKTYSASLTLDSGDAFYTDNGISIYNAITVSLDFTQTISLDAGWNMISGFIDPNNHSITSIASNITGSLSQIRNISGLAYRPPFATTLTTWNKYQAYQVKMNSAGSLLLTGSQIIPQSDPLTLTANSWNWIPYFRTSSLPITQALSSINGKYQQVKNMTGKVYWVPYITTLNQFVPGNGYMIKINQNAILTYPANSVIKASVNTAEIYFQSPKVFIYNEKATGKTSVIGLELANAEDGDEIAAFTKDGMLVGSAVWSEGSHGIVVWGDNETTIEKDGASEDEELVIKVWKNASKSIETIKALAINDQSTGKELYTLTYKTDAMAVVSGIIDNAEVSPIRISPQPAYSEAFITIANTSFDKVNLSIYNQAGSLVQTVSDNLQNGMIRINTSEIPSGVYSIIANVEGKVYNQRIIIAR